MSRHGERGVTLIEITVVLMAVAILTAAAAPIASRTVERSRLARAKTDEQAISTAMSNFITDAGATYRQPRADGNNAASAEVDMLVGDGDTPESNTDTNWTDPVGQFGPGAVVDFIENHLVQNEPFDDPVNNAYGTFWRGAYLQGPVDPDPWGNRYMINTEWLNGTATEMRNDTFVLSAGPNELTDTFWQQDGAVPGDDDLIVVIRRDLGLTVPQ